MNNYEYIIASLPVLRASSAREHGAVASSAEKIIAEIREQLSSSDRVVFDFFLSGYNADNLNKEFYTKALSHRSKFIQEFFAYDLGLRNAKVEYLNASLGRPKGQDEITVDGMEDTEFEGRGEVMAVLNGKDILEREKGLDDLMWKKADELTIMEVFSLSAILGFVAKLKITDRWEKLDPETGMQYFRKLVKSIRETYDNKKNTTI